MNVWLFGYGSLIWRPEIDFLERRQARVSGWSRRFWQGSHDHRGLPDSPGRVVTLIEDHQGTCDGMAYLVARQVVEETFAQLDHREKNGYQRHQVLLEFADHSEPRAGLVYIAPLNNHAYLGPAPLAQMAAQIRDSAGPSGRNIDYLYDLAGALRKLNAVDAHVFELEKAVQQLNHQARSVS